jgi:small subunit ribosomal protein S9
VWLVPGGSGNVVVNGSEALDYFKRETSVMVIRQPLEVTERSDHYDIKVSVKGGGLSGQAGAVRLGIARALTEAEPDLRQMLKQHGMLTRDSRMIERKKYGQPGARKKFQFSKR